MAATVDTERQGLRDAADALRGIAAKLPEDSEIRAMFLRSATGYALTAELCKVGERRFELVS